MKAELRGTLILKQPPQKMLRPLADNLGNKIHVERPHISKFPLQGGTPLL